MALTDVLLPTIAKGIIMRHSGVMALSEWFDVIAGGSPYAAYWRQVRGRPVAVANPEAVYS